MVFAWNFFLIYVMFSKSDPKPRYGNSCLALVNHFLNDRCTGNKKKRYFWQIYSTSHLHPELTFAKLWKYFEINSFKSHFFWPFFIFDKIPWKKFWSETFLLENLKKKKLKKALYIFFLSFSLTGNTSPQTYYARTIETSWIFGASCQRRSYL